MESPLEGLIQTFKTMKVEGWDWRKVKLVMMLRMNAVKHHKLLKQDYVWQMLEFFDSASSHYWNSEFMKFNELYSAMMSSSGGVSTQFLSHTNVKEKLQVITYTIQGMEEQLCMCFNVVAVNKGTIENIKELLHNKKTRKDR